MISLLRLFSLRYFRDHKLRTLLAFSAISLGVALFVSSYVTNVSVVASIEQTKRDLAGKAEWQVTRGRSLGVEETLLEKIRTIPNVIAAPVIQASVPLMKPHGETLLILGIEFLNDSLLRLYKIQGGLDAKTVLTMSFVPNGILIADSFAARNGLKVGSPITVETNRGTQTLRVTGLLEDAGPVRTLSGRFGVMELHTAQRLFRRPGLVDRIEVAGASRAQLEAACPGFEVESIVALSSMVQDALSRVQALVIVSVIALLVGLFIIYNTVQVSIVERVKDIGIIRALGATRSQVLSLLLLEWMVLGLLGSVMGVVLGYLLARQMLGVTARAVNALIPLVTLTQTTFPPLAVVSALIVGIGTTLVGAYGPAWHALGIPAIEAVRPHTYRLAKSYWLLFVRGLVMTVVGVALVSQILRYPYAGLASVGLIFWGVAMMLPQLVIKLAHAVRELFRKLSSVEGFLAADNMVKFPQRTALTIVTLGGALGMMVATAALVDGLRIASTRWLVQAFPFDFAITSNNLMSSLYSQHTVPRALVDQVRKVDGVTSACAFRTAFSDYHDKDILVMGIETVPYVEMQHQKRIGRWARPFAQPENLSKLRSGQGLFVSENLAYFFNLRAGDRITLKTPSGPHSAVILQTLEDYSWPHGVVIMDFDVWTNLWKDDDITYIGIGVQRGVSTELLRERIEATLKGLSSVYLYTMEEIRRIGREILDQTVAVANIQVLIAIFIGSLGIVNTLLISVLQRSREIGLLRAVGMTRGQVARTVVLEGILMALVGSMVGLAEGLLGGWVPVRYFELSITGYLTPIVVPWGHAVVALVIAVSVGIVASLVPARRAASLDILDAIGYE